MFEKLKRGMQVASLSLPFMFGACEDSVSSFSPVREIQRDFGADFGGIIYLDSDLSDSNSTEDVFVPEVDASVTTEVDASVTAEVDAFDAPEICTSFSVSFERLSDARFFYFKNEFTHVMDLVVSADCNRKFELNFNEFIRRFEQSVDFKYELDFRGSSLVTDGDSVSIYLKGRHLHDSIYLDGDENGIVDHVDIPTSIEVSGPLNFNITINGNPNHFIYEPFDPKFAIFEIAYPDLITIDIDYLMYDIVLYSDLGVYPFNSVFQLNDDLTARTAVESPSLLINNGNFGGTNKYCSFSIVSLSNIIGYITGETEFRSPIQTNYSFSLGLIAGYDFQTERFLNQYSLVNDANELAENSCALLPNYLNVLGADGRTIKLPNSKSDRPFVIGFNQ